MTHDAKKVLKGLIRTQLEEDGAVYIDYSRLEASTVRSPGEPCETYCFPEYSSKIRSILSYLAKEEMIEFEDALKEYCRVTHEGWRFRSESLKQSIQRFINSFIAPIGVAFATTMIALWLNGSFQ